jgi:dTDP-4-amino-4,6-dideoxygalactose transaminase
VAVHTFGNPADIETLVRFARQHQLKLVFDAAHGFGTQYHAVPVGIQGDAQVFSTSPTKLLVTGEGGVVTTNSDEIADWIRCGREYGMRGAQGVFAGVNARLSEVHALLGQWSLRVLEQAATHRNVLAARYRTSLCHLPGLAFQEVNAGNRHSWKDFPITIDPTQCGLTRDAVAQYLATKGIETRAYYDPPAHQHLAYQQVFEENRAQAATRERGQRLLPVTEWLSTHILCLPIWSDMPESILDEICEHLIALWAQQGSC